MGNKSADAYNLSVGLGLASYQASVKQPGLASTALANARPAANALVAASYLTQAGFDSLYSPPDVAHAHLESVRVAVARIIGDKSVDAANVYRVGLLIALAEGQTTSTEWNKSFTGPNALAHQCLEQAQLIIRSFLGSVQFDPTLMTKALDNTLYLSNQDTAHTFTHDLRVAYQQTALLSPTLP